MLQRNANIERMEKMNVSNDEIMTEKGKIENLKSKNTHLIIHSL